MDTSKVNDRTILFCDYYKQWITVYKEGAIRPVTMNKYNMAHHRRSEGCSCKATDLYELKR